jgi:hypothetical protein
LSVFSDFDLEAQIKTLPACSLEKVVRPKRNVGKSSLSESDSWNTIIDGLPIETPGKIQIWQQFFAYLIKRVM